MVCSSLPLLSPLHYNHAVCQSSSSLATDSSGANLARCATLRRKWQCSPSVNGGCIAWHNHFRRSRPSGRELRKCAIICGVAGRGVQRENIKVIVNGAAGRMGQEAIRAITNARGMEIAGAVDQKRAGEDAGEVAGLDEALEVPILNDLVMVLSSVAQARNASAVMVDFTEPKAVFENVRQAVAFGIFSVVGTRGLSEEKILQLQDFCDKSSMGCLVVPNLSIGAVLQQQAAAAAAYHYGNVEIIETKDRTQGSGEEAEVPSLAAQAIAAELSELGRTFNADSSSASQARGAALGANVRVHSLELPGVLAGQEVRFGAPAETYSISHQVYGPKAYMPGLLLAIRRVVRLKSLVYGLEKVI